MNDWKSELYKLEKLHEWDAAITLMEHVTAEKPYCIDAHLCMAFLLMNLLVEEHDCDSSKIDDYIAKLNKCYDESVIKFSEDPAYLYYMAIIGVISPWFFNENFDEKNIDAMIKKAKKLDPINPIYQDGDYSNLDYTKKDEREKLLAYAIQILDPNSAYRQEFARRGSLGEYMFDIREPWAKKTLASIENFSKENICSSQVVDALQYLLLTTDIPQSGSARNNLAENLNYKYQNQNKALDMILHHLRNNRTSDFFSKEEAYQAIMDFLLKYYNEYHEEEILAFKNQLAENKAVFEKYFSLILHQKNQI